MAAVTCQLVLIFIQLVPTVDCKCVGKRSHPRCATHLNLKHQKSPDLHFLSSFHQINCSFPMPKMTKPWPTLHSTELSLLLAMVCYVNSAVLICHPFLSYHLTMLVAFVSVPCCFFIICNCLEMEKSFGSLYWHHFLFLAAHLTNLCESNNQDFARGYLIFLLGVLSLSFYTIYIWYRNWVNMKKVRDQKRSDSSEESVVPLLIEISFSFLGNGTAMMGRWYIPRDSFLRLVVGAGIMFSIGVVFFCYYLFSSGKSRSHNPHLQESDISVN
ncbi:Uncharacterized protein TCM_020212 [Theobroma cacao]|uniref:Uncharacterized protein n=1 Tax=Theobroma cacao TaxID=3641 RepID=A0A061EJE2_THECC|nr:Uncharacterized protein TCM_020212 [Theobroma cacao]